MTEEFEHEERLSVTPPLLQGIGPKTRLTPKAKKIYNRASRLKRKNWLLERKQHTLRKRLNIYENMTRSEIVNMAALNINPVMKQFIMNQLDMEGQKPKGRRFSLKDKVLAVSFYKQSPKMYRLLSKIFSMPSKNTVMRMLKKVPVKPGFNDTVFNNLKCSVEKLQDHEKSCILMFDEMSIKPHLQLNIDAGNVMGFQHFGERTSNVIANTATVFMIKGITKKWKQPVFYGFSGNGMKTIDLVRTIKEVIKKCQETGLRVVSTICDKGSSNVAAINYLNKRSVEEALRKGETQEDFTFNVDGKKIIPLYDPPHLIKGIRNNMVKKDLIWEKKNNEKLTCKWNEIQKAYNIDNHSGELRLMPKLNDNHIFEHKMSKMKVAHATQVLSYTVAKSIGMFARTSLQAEDGTCLEKRVKEILFWDQLFDSCNGETLYPQQGKTLRCAVSKTSPHIKFWREARKNLSQMYFQKKGSTEKYIPPSLKNWIITVRGMELLVKELLQGDMSFFAPRTFNQDSLGELFWPNPSTFWTKSTSWCKFFRQFLQNFVSE